jgi:hypothetical protein
MVQVFLPVLRFTSVSIIPLIHYYHIHLHLALTTMTYGRSFEDLSNNNIRSEISQSWIGECVLPLGLLRVKAWW